MIGASENLSAEFYEWEARGRGRLIWDGPVVPEPPFWPFARSGVPAGEPVSDDGRKPTILSLLARKVADAFAARPVVVEEAVPEERPPAPLIRERLVEIEAHLPPEGRFDRAASAGFFASVAVYKEPIAFEIVAALGRIAVRFAVGENDAPVVLRQLEAFFPEAAFTIADRALEEEWSAFGERSVAAVEFCLGREFMIPLVAARGDPFVALVGAMGEIDEGEAAVFQVLFAPVAHAWSESIQRSVTHADGKAFFVNAPELASGASEKTASALFAAIVRVAANAADGERAWEIAVNMGGALGIYGSPRGNELVPLENNGYPVAEHHEDILRRQSRRSGMILNADELAGFVHLPSGEVRSARLRPTDRITKVAPALVRAGDGLTLGHNVHQGAEVAVTLSDDTRSRHIHVVGASGTGKSTLLYNLIREDMERGYGLTVLDPHGDLIDRVLAAVSAGREGDVVLLDPSDEEYVVGFNVLRAHSDWERNLLASDLVAVFRRLSSAWGDQLNSVLSNALLAFMESDRDGTLLDVRRFLLEPKWRAEFLGSVRDPNLRYYWQKVFPVLTGNKSVGPVVTRLDTFLSPKALRYMVAQKENKIDFGDIIDSGKIFLAKLSEGFVGKENAHLLGSFLVSKLQSAAMARQRESESARRFHTLYADEFHNFLTPSLAECLSGVRKYRLGLVLAHQELRQVERDQDVASALLNAGTRVVFRVGERDARALEGGFSSFAARDIQNLETGEAICRVERSDWDFNLAVEAPVYPDAAAGEARRAAVVAASRGRYGSLRAEIEARLSAVVEVEEPSQKAEPEPEADGETIPEAPPPAPVPASLPAVEVKKEETKPAQPPATDLGKGGAQHKAIQERIKAEAEAMGFRVSVEQEVLGGAGQIDLVLAREGLSIACEVTVTGTIDYEVGNVAKCLKAGFDRVVVVGVSEEKLAKLRAAVANSLGTEKAERVSFYLPDALIRALQEMPKAEPKSEPVKRTRGGRAVKRTVVALSPEEAKEREERALRLMAAMMKRAQPSA